MRRNAIYVLTLAIALVFAGLNSMAQTKEDAGTAYNAALELSKTDMPAAIDKMLEVVKMCNSIGAEADDLKSGASKAIPGWQYNLANGFLKEKNYDQAIPAFEKSADLAKQFNDANILEKSENQLPKIYYAKGQAMLKAENADEALTWYDKSLKYDPEFAKAYVAKGQAFKKKGDNAKMQENLEIAIEKGTKSNDTTSVNNAKSLLASSLLSQGNAAFKKNDFTGAIAKLDESLKYNNKNKEAHFLLAVCCNNAKNFDRAIESANNGLALDENTNDKAARYYFEIAKAYDGKKDVANACANYKKAAFGAYKAQAEYQITTVLKCK